MRRQEVKMLLPLVFELVIPDGQLVVEEKLFGVEKRPDQIFIRFTCERLWRGLFFLGFLTQGRRVLRGSFSIKIPYPNLQLFRFGSS